MNCSCEGCVTKNFAEVFTDFEIEKCLSIEAQWIVAVLCVAGFLVGFAIIECVVAFYYGRQLCQNYLKNRSARHSRPRRTGVQVLELNETIGQSKCTEEDVIDHYRAQQQQGEYTVVGVMADPTDYETPTPCFTPALNQSEALYDRLADAPVTVEHMSHHAAASGRTTLHAGTALKEPSITQNQASKLATTTPTFSIQNTIEGDYDVIHV